MICAAEYCRYLDILAFVGISLIYGGGVLLVYAYQKRKG